jgi:hypothetical protein
MPETSEDQYPVLVSPENEAYRKWQKDLRRRLRSDPKRQAKMAQERRDLDAEINLHQSKWENAFRAVLATFIEEHALRILKFRDGDQIRYREIDFIEKRGGKFRFFEFKFRDNVRKKGGFSEARNQVLRSMQLAQSKYDLHTPAVIIVDMSEIFGLPPPVQDVALEFQSLSEVASFLDRRPSDYDADRPFTWIPAVRLHSMEFFAAAKSIAILSDADLIDYRETVTRKRAVNSVSYSTDGGETVNNPFLMLKNKFKDERAESKDAK